MRLFIAAQLPTQTIKELVKTQEILRAHSQRGSLTQPQNLHLTIKFLGEVYDNKIDSVISVLNELRQFEGTKGEVKQISTLKAANIVCAKLKFDQTMQTLEHYLSQRLQDIGIEVERRPFTPHITLMRKYSFAQPFAQIASGINIAFSPFQISSVTLFSSFLEQGKPPRYEVLQQVALEGKL